jgi:hypothetical protein
MALTPLGAPSLKKTIIRRLERFATGIPFISLKLKRRPSADAVLPPTLNAFIAGLTGTGGMSDALTTTESNAQLFGKGINSLIGIVSGFITFLREAIGLLTSMANQLIAVANVVPGVNISSIPNIAPSMNQVPQLPQTTNAIENRVTKPTTVNNITVQALDSESAARAVSKVLTQASARSIPALSGTSVRGN